MANRKRSKVDQLPPHIKEVVEQMMTTPAEYTYADIANYIKSQGFDISVTSVWRHASSLHASLETLRAAQENFRVIMDEIAKYPQLDTTEGIIRLLSYQVLNALHSRPAEQLDQMEVGELIRQATGLIRAAAYKSNIDVKNRELMDAGLESVKVLVFEAMAKERPDLYSQVTKFLADKQQEGVK